MSAPPTTLGKYQIIREIARSNDVVYEAYDPLMNRRVALKELAMPGGASDQQRQERLDRFKREARAAGTLAHPNIMTVYELGEDGGRHFIAMEFLDGHTLRNEIDSKGPLTGEKAMSIAKEILKGLEFAHSNGVIHRDIKPDNIQLLSDGRVKITDFGIARLTFEPNITLNGQVFGTPSYMSPEQINGKEIDARSDLFSVGVLLYEMVAGTKPFTGDSVVSISYAILNQEAPTLTLASWSLKEVVQKAIDKTPSQRYQSAEEFIVALETAERQSNSPAPQSQQASGYFDPYAASQPPQIAAAGFPNVIPSAPPVINPGFAGAPPAAAYGGNTYLQPYDPYSQGAYGTVPQPYGYANVANYGQAPIYYPPPPAKPLMTPETKAFVKTFMLVLLIITTAIAVIVVIINSVATYAGARSEENREQVESRLTREAIATLPVDQQIKRLQKERDTLVSPVVREDQDQYTATLYSNIGENSIAVGDFETAERSFSNAASLDPTNGAYEERLSSIYDVVAKQQHDAQEKMLLWAHSVDSMIQAASVEQDPILRSQYANQAAFKSVSFASGLAKEGRLFDARMKLLDVEKLKVTDPNLENRVKSMLTGLESQSTYGKP